MMRDDNILTLIGISTAL